MAADYDLIIIGGGLSGLAAGIRYARFGHSTLILEQHSLPGGLNSYYFRAGRLFETGLHAMTNFAPPGDKRAPLNRLFRQLKLSRKNFHTHEQIGSEIRFPGCSLRFCNDPALLEDEIRQAFPGSIDAFRTLVQTVREHDPFASAPWSSARAWLRELLGNSLLEDMLLLPLMVYGNAEEHDMDLAQFVIMFRAVFLEGFFRPRGTIKDLLELLLGQLRACGGEIRYQSRVSRLLHDGREVQGVVLADGAEITGKAVCSTVGIPGTCQLVPWPLEPARYTGKMSFMESIFLLPGQARTQSSSDRTIIFYSNYEKLRYKRPQEALDPNWGVICFPENFSGLPSGESFQIRVTNPASFPLWRQAEPALYRQWKKEWSARAAAVTGKIIGPYAGEVIQQDCFTPATIEHYSKKAEGAVYGSPIKIKDGRTPYRNLFIAGTDQGYLGIVGAMLSGVSMVNLHLLQQ